MNESEPPIVPPGQGPSHASPSIPPYTLETLAQLAGIPPDLLLDYCRRGVLGVTYIEETARLEFDDDTLYELRRVHRLRLTHEVNLQALPLLAGLLREIDRLREELRSRRSL